MADDTAQKSMLILANGSSIVTAGSEKLRGAASYENWRPRYDGGTFTRTKLEAMVSRELAKPPRWVKP